MSRKSSIKTIVAISLVVFLLAMLGLFFNKYQVNIEVGQEYGSLPATTISNMILMEMGDEEIIGEINKKPSLVHEVIYADLIGMRTPLITAVFYKRDVVAEHIIQKGGQVEISIKLLEDEGIPEYGEFIDALRQWQTKATNEKAE